MLTRILDTTQIDMTDPQIAHGLEIDIRRMDLLEHRSRPAIANAYRVVATNSVFFPNLCFELQYGIKSRDNFEPIGGRMQYNTETLPFLD
jgi:hypothetical protein